MRFLESPSTDAAFNLALEQLIFDALPRSESYFMLWQNHSAVVIGRHQNAWAEVNSAYIRARGIKLVRRRSGGGAVYHDLGNLNFTFVTDAPADGELDFRAFCQPVLAVLRSLGVKAEAGGRNDISIDGKKFSGNAQYIRAGRLMHHGTILFESDLDTMADALCPDAEKLDSKGIPSVRSRVTNIKPLLSGDICLADFQRRLAAEVCGHAEPTPLPAALLAQAEDIAAKRYSRWDWNWGESPRHSIQRRARFDGVGSVALDMQVENGRIAALRFYGDFFSLAPPEDLAAALLGTPIHAPALRAALDALPIARYIRGLTAQSLASLFD